MPKRSFLKPLSVVLAALASAAAWGTTKQLPATAPLVPENTASVPVEPSNAPIAPNESRALLFQDATGDIFKFVLERNAEGQFLAQHQSHWSHNSHSSHSSHASHSSHYSGR